MKHHDEALQCCVCTAVIYPDASQGYIRQGLPFCTSECDEKYDPAIHKIHHPKPKHTPQQKKRLNEYQELQEALDFLRNENNSTSHDDELVEQEKIPLDEYFNGLKSLHAPQVCVVL